MSELETSPSPFHGDAIDLQSRFLPFFDDQARFWLEAGGDAGVRLLAEFSGHAFEMWPSAIDSDQVNAALPPRDSRWMPDGIADLGGLSDSQLDELHEATAPLQKLVSDLLVCGWRVSNQLTVSDEHVPRITVIADPPSDANEAAGRRAANARRLAWGAAELTWSGPPPARWGDDWQLDSVRVAGIDIDISDDIELIILDSLWFIAVVAAPPWTLSPGFDHPAIRHSDGGQMPATVIAVAFDDQVAKRTPEELADLKPRVAAWGDEHGFRPAIADPTKKSVGEALHGIGDGLSGYYLLGFDNGDSYLGQSIQIPTRVATHRRERPGLTSVRLLPDPAVGGIESPSSHLLGRERTLIHSLQQTGLPVRNKAEMTYWSGHRDVDDVFASVNATAEEWLADPIGINKRGISLQRKHTPDMAAAAEAMKVLADRAGDQLELMLSIQRTYLERCLPLPTQTEYEWWVISSPLNTPPWGTLSNLSVGWTECLRINTDFTCWVQVNGLELFGEDYASDDDDDDWIRFARRHPGATYGTATYSTGGAFNLNLNAPNLETLAELLDDTAVTRAAATAALNYMRVRRVGAIKNSHNPVLAKTLFGSEPNES